MKQVLFAFLFVLSSSTVMAQGNHKIETHEERYPSGASKVVYQFYRTDEGKEVRHGNLTVWHENGQKQLAATLKDGEGVGVLTRWYPSGKIEAEVEEDGMKGRETLWYEAGKKQKETKYHEEDLQVTSWYPDGAKEMEVKIEGGTGKEQFWYTNGQLRQTREIQNGAPQGELKCWDCKGRVLCEAQFENGRCQRGASMRWGSDYRMAVIEEVAENGHIKQTHVVPLYDEKTDIERVQKDHVSKDKTYGVTKENPVKLGGGQLGVLSGAEASRRYLRHLRTKSLVPFDFTRVGSEGGIVCGKNRHVVDTYNLVSRDGKEQQSIYIDMYHDDMSPLDALAPQGFLLLKSQEDGKPTLERKLDARIEGPQKKK
jgi:antitoxin component YwqK of YwqJK toxin-antitoxin module